MNKKFYNYTAKHKRKKRSRETTSFSFPAWVGKMRDKRVKTKIKRCLHKVKQGMEIEFPFYVRDAGWHYW